VVFPEAVDAQRHEVVHGVVAAGDGGEDGGDWGSLRCERLFLLRVDDWMCVLTFRSLQALSDSLIAEMRCLFRLFPLLFGSLQ
jgi:hypothetical protein